MPLTLWSLALTLRQTEAPSRRTLIALAVAATALFYLHLSAFLFFRARGGPGLGGIPRLAPAREVAAIGCCGPRRSRSSPSCGFVNSPVVHPQSVGWAAGRCPWLGKSRPPPCAT